MRSSRRETLLIFLVLAGFAVICGWLMLRAEQSYDTSYFPALSTYSPRPDGCLALFRLLKESGLRPVRHHESEYHYPDGGFVIAIQGPPDAQRLMRGSLDPRALRLWMEAGGRLLLLDADTMDTVSALINELEATGDAAPGAPPERLATGGSQATAGKLQAISPMYFSGCSFRLPDSRPPLFEAVGELEIAAPSIRVGPGGAVLLAAEFTGASAPGQFPLIVHRQVGKGELVWMPSIEIWSNAWIGRADNHKLALALVEGLAGGDPVYIDENLHGYSASSRGLAALMFGTTGGRILLGAALACVLLFAGAVVRPARYAAQPVIPRRQATETVLAQADLYQRAGARHIVAECLVERTRRALMEHLRLSGLPSEAQLLEWLRSNRELVRAEPELEAYLSSKILARTGAEMLALARACDRARLAMPRAARSHR